MVLRALADLSADAKKRQQQFTGKMFLEFCDDNGIHVTGGGALLRGLDKRLQRKTKLPIHIAEDPLRAVVRGTGAALKNIQGFRNVLLT